MAGSDPIVIIGAGINALVAAALLSRKGRKVLVLERSDRPGGCMRTDEITLPGFRHDVMAATFVLFLTGPAMAELGEDLARHGLEFCHGSTPTGVIRPDGSGLVLTTDRAQNVGLFAALAPGDGERYRADVESVEANADLIFALLGQPLWSRQTVKLLGKQAWTRGLGPMKEFFGAALEPARGWLEQTYEAPELQALFAPWVLHTGLTPESTYSGQMGRVIAFALEAAGAPVVKGGAGEAASAFARLIAAQGGEVRCNTEVTRIVTERGRAVAVETAGGDRIAAAEVIASVPPKQLFEDLLDTPPAPEAAAARRYRHGRGNFQLHYALDADPDWIAPGMEDVALIHLTDGIDAVSRSSNEAVRGLLPAVPTICVGQPHRLDPGRCPAGKAILWCQIPDAPRRIKGDAAGEIDAGDGTWTEVQREAFADRIETILRAHIRNFDRIRLGRRAYSPADLEAMNPNLVGGDPYGGSCEIDQFFVLRPFGRSVNYDTGVARLHMIGAATHPGPGLGGGSGFNLAKRLGA